MFVCSKNFICTKKSLHTPWEVHEGYHIIHNNIRCLYKTVMAAIANIVASCDVAMLSSRNVDEANGCALILADVPCLWLSYSGKKGWE